MAFNYGEMRVIRVDPRFVKKIKGSARMASEQGPGFLSGWGGASQYQSFASMPMEERLVYAATLEGNTTPSEIEIVTGLTPAQVTSGLNSLQQKGALELEGEEIPI